MPFAIRYLLFADFAFIRFSKLAARDQDISSAGIAFQTDVCAQASHRPLVAAARMLLA